jgi:hypothetical protein
MYCDNKESTAVKKTPECAYITSVLAAVYVLWQQRRYSRKKTPECVYINIL